MTRARQVGFSLVELILVIVILGTLAGVITVFVRPAVEGFLAQRSRSEIQSAAQAALQAMQRDVRAAVPNSVRYPNDQCFELVPTRGGGRYRMRPDTTASGSAWLDTGTSASQFDVLGPLNGSFVSGDYVVIGNQNGDEVYTGANRSTLSGAAAAGAFGSTRLQFASKQFPGGYAGGRFLLVPAAQQAVFYVCENPGVVAGEGTGTLFRNKAYGFNGYPASCPAGSGEVMATRVSACSFVYNSNALTEYGVMSLRLELTRSGETVGLQFNSMVSNIP